MTRSRRRPIAPLLVASLSLASLFACGEPPPVSPRGPAPCAESVGAPSPEASPAARPSETALYALFAAEWDAKMKDEPTYASRLGDRRWNDQWENRSLPAFAARRAHRVATLAKLDAIDRASLSPAAALDFDLFRRELATTIELDRFDLHLLPVDQREGIQTDDDLASDLRFETTKDYEDWAARLAHFGARVDQTMALMREGMKKRVVFAKVVMGRLPAQIDKQIVDDPAASPFYKPFKSFARGVPEADRARVSQAARASIKDGVVPAFRRFKEFFAKAYLPACTDAVGLWQLPEGDAMYAALARRHTTTALTPAEIHALGLREVSRIRAEMQTIMVKLGYKGTLKEFFTFLRTDPRFYLQTPEALLQAYAALAKRIDPRLVRVIKTLPRTPYGVEPIPAAIAPDTTTAYYREPAPDGSRAGTYFVNLFRPETRPTWEMMALSLHESVPGHHLQIALAMEQTSLPEFRRHGEYTAFVEGWGLYAESLGEEMGLYDDPYAKFGQLTYEMWRAVRLVVDTGMHAMHWERKKAIDYFLDNAAKQELDVTNEIDRYLVMPGQALAYKMGELRIKALRAKAEAALGAKFDLREFHDAILDEGAMPLDVLEKQVDAWVAAKSR